MQDAGTALMGIGSARGADRAIKAAELAVASPLLELSIEGAQGVLLSVQGGSTLGLYEIHDAAKLVAEAVHPDANILFGAVIDDSLGDEVRVTVIAAGFSDSPERRGAATSSGSSAPEAKDPTVAGGKPEESWLLPSANEQLPPEAPLFATDADEYAELDVPDFLR
jgi:cell division protein FtsZ